MELPIKAIEIVNIHIDWKLIRYGLYKELEIIGDTLILRNGFININLLKERINPKPITIEESDIEKCIEGNKFLSSYFVLIQSNIDNSFVIRLVELNKDSIIINLGDELNKTGIDIRTKQLGSIPLKEGLSTRKRCKKIALELLKPPSLIEYNNQTFIFNEEGKYILYN